MKGTVEIVLKDEQGNVVHQEKDHNLVTNFFREYFRPLGPTREYPYDYTIESMIGGILLMEDTISPESATTVNIPAGNKMIGNACVGKINGPGTAVTELGSYNSANTGWQENGDYQMQFEWTPSQANGQISAICLTSKAWGFVGEGNSTSHAVIKSSPGSAYNPFSPSSVSMGTEHTRQYVNGKFCVFPGVSDNFNYYVDFNQFKQNASDNISRTGKLIVSKYYFPRTELDFYRGRYNVVTPLEETQYNIPSNVISDFVSASSAKASDYNKITKETNTFHSVWASASPGTSYEYTPCIYGYDSKIFCFHVDIEHETITADSVTLSNELVDKLYETQSKSSVLPISAVCNGTTLVISRYNLNGSASDNGTVDATRTSCPVFFVNISTGTYVESELTFPTYNVMLRMFGIVSYIPNLWYMRLGTDATYTQDSMVCKFDAVDDTAVITSHWNAGASGDNTNQPYYTNNVEYPLASLNVNGSGYVRHQHYIATIYNLSTPVTKTANLSMQITYTLSFAEEE